ncbi:AI-2E family transporter [Paenibacillus macquariensis]|uniref:Predicted PurR-regulated permease PerM n=1 Tax=Paenibacillus macquariensis TaxID=948756 RepID=A0ABY1JNF6_9BACL|nr:AI-2E family transporter [Paenibacillus macquariensis]MEC0092171.1 AI-2E family transporter [Paenibacillus macquariensis]OAB37278.1 AI-2E family transporter [Paenibacillus macquariensis subsp. macquariensis]SIQ49748.1 Predicted PurR-regulated permease PerM [Paenibacillus macquariensis]
MTSLNRFIKICIAIILVFIIIYLGSLVDFVFKPFLSLFSIIMVPLMLATFFYYLLRPLVNKMVRPKLNRTMVILIIYLIFAILLGVFIIGVFPSLRTQFFNLVDNGPNLLNALSKQLQDLEQTGFLSKILPDDVSPLTQLNEYLNKGFSLLTNYLAGMFSFFSNFAVILLTFPILLFYMLKEGDKFGQKIVSFMPMRFREEGKEVVHDIDHAISGFIVGRVVVNLALGVLMYIGFLVIGLPYALLLTAVAVIMNFIPFIGAILSAIPIVIIGLIESPSVAIWSLVVILVAQQVQDNIISPYIFGKQLDIHPLTTIILVLVGSDVFGIIGVIVIIPVYMIVKIVVVKMYQLFFKQKWEDA